MRRLLAPALAVLMLAACSPGFPQGATGSASESVAPSTASGPGSASGTTEWDPRTWVPTVTIAPIIMTEAEKKAFRTTWLARMAAGSGIANPPQVSFERWVSGADFGESVGSCLADKGFEGEWDGRFGFNYPQGIPASQDAAFAVARYECNARFTIDPPFLQEWTADQIGLMYDYWNGFYIPCLEAQGVHVDTSQRPSRESFVASFPTPQRSTWWPEDAVMALPKAQAAAVAAACDPYPPDDVFYGTGS